MQTCKDANPSTLLRASTLGASAAVLYTTTAEPCLSISDSLGSYARASRVPPLSVFVVRDGRDAACVVHALFGCEYKNSWDVRRLLESMELPTMDGVSSGLLNATRAVIMDLQAGTQMRVQRRGTSNESMYALTSSSCEPC